MHREFSQADLDPRHVLSDPPDEADEVVELIRKRLDDGSFLVRSIR